MMPIHSHNISVHGTRTHYLEAGSGFPLVLLHSGEFGACAELTWERNIGALAEHFRVIAPDWLGYGGSAKLFSFDSPITYRIDHITRFLEVMAIDRAHFAGNSMGATFLLATAASRPCPWPIEKLVAISGGGTIPDNQFRATLNSYDGTEEHMAKILEAVFANPEVQSDRAYIARRNALAREEGAWECTAAARFRAPWRVPRGMLTPPDYSPIDVPTLLITGAKDKLRDAGFGLDLQRRIPGSKLHVVAQGGHCPQIDEPGEVNRAMLDFLVG